MPLCSCALGELRSYLPEQLLKSVCVHVRRSPTTILCFKGAWRVARGAALGGRTTQPKTPPPGRDASLRTKLKSPFYKYVTELSLNAEVNNATNLKNRNIDWYSSPPLGNRLRGAIVLARGARVLAVTRALRLTRRRADTWLVPHVENKKS